MSVLENKIERFNTENVGIETFEKLCKSGKVTSAYVVRADADKNLYLDLGSQFIGVMNYDEVEFSPFEEVKPMAILSRIGRYTCFKVTEISEAHDTKSGKQIINLSRREVQKEYYEKELSVALPGTIIPTRVKAVSNKIMYCDLGYGITGALYMTSLSVSRIYSVGHDEKDLFVILKEMDSNGRWELSHKELLGTWDEVAAQFSVGDTVVGIVSNVTEFGVFISIDHNLIGLADFYENAECEPKIGDVLTVYIKSIVPATSKVKLCMVSHPYANTNTDFDRPVNSGRPFNYKLTSGRVYEWNYNQNPTGKMINSKFCDETPSEGVKVISGIVTDDK